MNRITIPNNHGKREKRLSEPKKTPITLVYFNENPYFCARYPIRRYAGLVAQLVRATDS